jgi:hypothetical protein
VDQSVFADAIAGVVKKQRQETFAGETPNHADVFHASRATNWENQKSPMGKTVSA